MPKKKVEVYDKDKLIYPFIENDHVTFSNGMKVSEMLDQGISMPTITHNETSFKVGIGDSDVSSSIVDSSVSKMVIKGQTYQNILPEPSTHVLTNNKEMFKVNEGLDSNVEIVDGVSKSAILKGQTLVNLLDRNNMSLESLEYTFVDGIFNVTTDRDWGKMKFNPALISNKKYILFIGSSVNNCMIYYRVAGGVATSIGHAVNAPIIFTTPSDQIVSISIEFPTAVTNGTVSYPMLLEYQEGMENWDIPYFEGMQSVKMPILTTTGKNLWSGKNITIGKYVDAEGYITNAETDFLSDFIEVKPNTTYAFKVMDSRATTPYGVKSLYDKNKKFISRGNGIHSNNVPFTTPSNCHYVRIHGNSYTQCGNTIPDCMLIETTSNPSTITTHEPYKSNILSTPEEVVLREVNGVKDTLNLNTGEYVQRIGEITFNGSESWQESGYVAPNHYCAFARVQGSKNALSYNIVCNSLPVRNILSATIDYEGCMFNEWSSGDKANVIVKIANSKLSSTSVEGIKAYLQSNPLTIQYELATPIIKTLDLSSSGNWEKVVLDGSENWSVAPDTSNNNAFFRGGNTVPNNVKVNSNNLAQKVICDILTPFTQDQICNKPNDNYGISLGWNDSNLCVRHKDFPLTNEGLTQWKQYLSQNPITVWYQTTNHKGSTQVKQPIFFKDGHIQLSSGADNSLIPTLDYQAKTSNSYVMDLMKANTRYTMKAKSASGTFTIDGTSYGAGTNGTFTTPSSMTNKFLVMSNKTNTEVMILEGDLTSKTIPYFKGIKSAFEGEDKIEVLSTGKNLITDVSLRKINGAIWDGDVLTYSGTSNDLYYTYSRTEMTYENAIKVKVGSCYEVGLEVFSGEVNVEYSVAVATFDKDLNVVRWLGNRFVVQQGEEYVGSIRLHGVNAVWTNIKFRMWMEEVDTSSNVGAYEPYKTNSTKIPLLSPLRSLPNGVCDEIILDRERNKAQIIQRVEEIVLNGTETWKAHPNLEHNKTLLFQSQTDNRQGKSFRCISDHFPCLTNESIWHNTTDSEGIQLGGGGTIYKRVDLRISKLKVSSNSNTQLQNYLNQHPTILLYELETPIITEVDLEGFPYIYKDGHIFLNSEIVPTTEIIYSINQCQQISASNEDIIRHEKELTYLQKLIAQYVQVDYESVLLSLKV